MPDGIKTFVGNGGSGFQAVNRQGLHWQEQFMKKKNPGS